MNTRERIEALLKRQKPDKVPFVPYDEMLIRGAFEREMINRGVGIATLHHSYYWCEYPHCSFDSRYQGNKITTTAHTPKGDIEMAVATHLSRKVTRARELVLEGWIKGSADFEPCIAMIEDEVHYPDYATFDWINLDFGNDGFVRTKSGIVAPYIGVYEYFGSGAAGALENFVYSRLDHPQAFDCLLDAYEQRNRRLYPLLEAAPATWINMGDINGHYGPREYRDYIVPWYQEYVPLLQRAGKVVQIHAHSAHLKAYKDLVPQTGVDVIDAFTPPPGGDLTLAEARRAWGDEMVICINFPESIFWSGVEATRRYTLDLLAQDPSGLLMISLTELGTAMLADDDTERIFHAGIRAVADAIDEFCG